MSCNLARSIWWSILSKALLRSRRTTAVSFFLSMAFRISSVVWMTDVSVECHCLFPLCLDDKRPLESRYDVSWLWATRSQTLERTGSNEIGLLLFGISWYYPTFRLSRDKALTHHKAEGATRGPRWGGGEYSHIWAIYVGSRSLIGYLFLPFCFCVPGVVLR